MSDSIKETAAEVAALIPRFSWELMDEEQRDALMENVVLPRYMKTTSDGIKTGPKFWGQLVGATENAVSKRINRLKQSQKDGGENPPDSDSYEATTHRHAKRILRDPERRKKALSELPDSELEAVRRVTAEVGIERSRAKRAEANTEPTVRELTDGENFDPSEHWADSRIVSADAAVAKLFARVEKYGLILGSMEPAEAYEFLTRMESRIGDVRAAVQERVNDEVMV